MEQGSQSGAVLLGSSGLSRTLADALERLGVDGPLSLVSAGWQEREGVGEQLRAAIDHPIVDLGLHARARALLDRDATLAATLGERQQRLRSIQERYRVRLRYETAAAITLLAMADPPSSLSDHTLRALETLRALDRTHLRLLAAVHAEPIPHSPALERAREEVRALLDESAATLIGGGHVVVLRNRLRLFGLDAALRTRPVIAWGAGAMVATERIVLFLDHGPVGPREPEIVDAGLGIAARVIALPGARSRLALSDRGRMGLIARRFSPARCIALDDAALVAIRGDAIVRADGAFRLSSAGRMPRVRAA